ncbi:MAG: hypothetical protein ACOC2Q_00785 [Spirochaetota bacterium]
MTARSLGWLLVAAAFTLAAAPLVAQDTDTAGSSGDAEAEDEAQADDDEFFEDPFAVDEEPGADTDDGSEAGGDAESEASSGEDGSGEDGFADDEFDSLFEDDDMIDTADESQMIENPQDELLESEGVRWGGRIRGSLTADWEWDDVWTSEFELTEPTSDSFTPTVGADLTFDARPEREFRTFGKLKIDTTDDGGIDFSLDATTIDAVGLPAEWTSEENEDGDTEIRDGSGTLITTIEGNAADGESDEEPELGNAPGLDVSVFELFSDFTWNDRLFFRFGKHTIQWGKGYFFSPADVLNLSAVDAEDPTADREGPVSLRTVYPFGTTGSAYLYAITNTGADVLDVAVAPKVEFALGPGELGIGAYYQRSLAPRFVLLGTASWGEVDFFGEGVALWGSDRVFVRPSRDQSAADADPDDGLELVLDTYTVDRGVFFQGTAGARYLKEWDGGTSLTLIGQYFFNGEGYEDTEGLLPAAARLLLNPGENGLAIENEADQPEGYEPPPDLAFGDLANWGRHYAGATVSLSSLFLDDLALSAFGLVNLTDLSAIVTPAITYRFLDRFSLGVSGRFTLGGADDEYTDPAALFTADEASPTFGLTLDIAMPGGSF